MLVLKSTYDSEVNWLNGRIKHYSIHLIMAQSEVKAKDERINKLVKEIKLLKAELDARPPLEYYDPNDDALGAAPVVVDWWLMNAVSIERVTNAGGYPMTVVSYRPSDAIELEEWYFHCNDQRHDELADNFADYIRNRN